MPELSHALGPEVSGDNLFPHLLPLRLHSHLVGAPPAYPLPAPDCGLSFFTHTVLFPKTSQCFGLCLLR